MAMRRTPLRTAVAATGAIGLAGILGVAPPAEAGGQFAARSADPAVEIVQAVGCVERRAGEAPWWLTRASEPETTRAGVFNATQVEEAGETALGSREFHLVGVPEFLGAEALLRAGDRASFTAPDQVNATNELREGRTVLVKGLLVESDAGSRINLLAVVGLADTCE